MDLFNWQGFLLLMVIFIPLERLLAMHPGQKLFRNGWQNDLIYVLVNGWLVQAGVIGLIIVGIVGFGALVPASWREAVAAQPYWMQTVQVLLIADVGFYLIHRLFHEVPWLWKFHAVHHSIEELDWLAAHRVHPIDQILTRGGSLVPCFALGYSEVALGIYAVIYHWHSILLHANVRIPFGPLRWLVASPEFHHWHHSDHSEAFNKNFAAQLSFLDVLFGTAHVTRGKVPTKYGCDDPVPPAYWQQLFYPFRQWLPAKDQRPPASSPPAEALPNGGEAVPQELKAAGSP